MSALPHAVPAPAPIHEIRLTIGGIAVSGDPGVRIVTILGSCIAVCIHDPVLRLSGMNHFMLPGLPGSTVSAESADIGRYGAVALERLINRFVAAGSRRGDLEVKLFGGSNLGFGLDIGGRNARFARDYLAHDGLRLVAEDTGGDRARKIVLETESGRVMRRFLDDNRVAVEAQPAQNTVPPLPPPLPHAGSVDLFLHRPAGAGLRH